MEAAANAMGFLAFRQRRFAQAHEIFHEALQRLAAAGLQRTEVYGKLLANLGRVCVELGLPAQALDYFRQAAETLAAAADPFHLGLLYFHVGVAWERQHSFDRAREFLQRSAELFAVHENIRLLGMVKRSLGMLHLEEGALAAAQEELDASLRLAGQCGDDEGMAQTLVELARLRARGGDAGGALRAAEDAAGSAAVRVRVDGGRLEEVLCEVDLDGARYTLSRVRAAPPAGGLSPREREIAALVAQGLPTKAIAAALCISGWTVCTHLRRIYARWGVGSRAAMVAKLLERGLL